MNERTCPQRTKSINERLRQFGGSSSETTSYAVRSGLLLLLLVIAGAFRYALLSPWLFNGQNSPPPLWQFGPSLRVAVKHGEVGNDDGHGQRDGQHAGQSAQGADEHPGI